jgi:hypothetical protein
MATKLNEGTEVALPIKNFLLDSREGLGYIKKCLEFSSQ